MKIVKNINGDYMGHEIDLGKYVVRTDLAIESVGDDIKQSVYNDKDIDVTYIVLNDEDALKISKKPGRYITISFLDVTDSDSKNHVVKVFKDQMNKLFFDIGIDNSMSCLVIGLGNYKSTPDSLGPGTIDRLIVTNHLYTLGDLESGFRRVSAFNPGVMGTTGIETSDIIKGIVDKLHPDFLIVVDALASSSLERVNRTIQITDTGIHPGSGIGNSRKEISFSTIGIPVIAIGVPTTVDAATIVSDTIECMTKHFSYTKNNIDNPMNKLIVTGGVNYLDKNVSVSLDDKKELLGLVGSLNHFEVRRLIEEVLNPVGYNFMVTPKEIDFVISKLCDVISDGLNMSLHEKFN